MRIRIYTHSNTVSEQYYLWSKNENPKRNRRKQQLKQRNNKHLCVHTHSHTLTKSNKRLNLTEKRTIKLHGLQLNKERGVYFYLNGSPVHRNYAVNVLKSSQAIHELASPTHPSWTNQTYLLLKKMEEEKQNHLIECSITQLGRSVDAHMFTISINVNIHQYKIIIKSNYFIEFHPWFWK